MDGLVVVDKPAGCTSHDVVGMCRRTFGQRRVGHGGTLDPDATGVLVVGLGQVTRLLRFLSALPKSYQGDLVLGSSTTTLDASGDTVASFDMSSVSLGDVQSAAARFVGEIDQVPPMVSAVKVGGRRLHQLAREGIEVERQPRRVVVHRFDVARGPERPDRAGSEGPEPDVYRIDVVCSAGTYVRTLADDVGRALGGGAHLRNLRRSGVGSFTVDEAVRPDQLTVDSVLPPSEALRDYARVVVDDAIATLVGHGSVLGRDAIVAEASGPWAVLDANGGLLAVYEDHTDGRVKPAVVLAGAGS